MRGAFAPGQVLIGRYRVIGLLGRGGMGEVYRADDLTLGTAVALKFLPIDAAREEGMLERFRSEVRTARAVAHPHVCRVYDIGEVDGRHFLSMEYVDGEDLATLLHRIGRLPSDKAIEIARQIAAGLAAAHEQGVLHRDLKPANVMIDGNGQARLTDFGLAVLTGEAAAEISGTPAYMAPEQLAGAPATPQSDLYALGLVFYELFTGKKPFEAHTLADWRRAHAETPPVSPSAHTLDLDPVVERLILRCLEKDPGGRPRSAAQVAMALPGGDPLAAALAAGETPSPEMVAAAGGEGALSPRRAWSMVGIFLALLLTVFLITPASTDLGLAPMTKSPDVLRDRAREVLRAVGHAGKAADEAAWMIRDYASIRWMADRLPSVEWRRRLKDLGAPVLLVFRRSSAPLLPVARDGVVTEADPAPAPGDVRVTLDARGRVVRFEATPARWAVETADSVASFPVEMIFRETGLDASRFQSVEARRVPGVPYDARREWVGTRAELPEMELRLCAATWRGQLVSITVEGPWDTPEAVSPLSAALSRRIGAPVGSLLSLVLCGAGLFFIRRNLRLGRGDRRGAARVAVAGFVLTLLAQLPGLHPSPDLRGFVSGPLFAVCGAALASGAVLWLIYLAIEPYLRRRMPELLVGWARVLEGRFRDPLVGRQILIGLTVGSLCAVLYHLVNAAPTWHPFGAQTTIPSFSTGAGRTNHMVPLAAPLAAAGFAVMRALGTLMTFFVLRLFISRRPVLIAVLALLSTSFVLGGENPRLETPLAFAEGLIIAWTLVRWGPLTLGIAWFAQFLLQTCPLRAAPSLWYAPYVLAAWVLLLGLAVWAFRVSLGGRSPLGSLNPDA